MNTIHEEVMTLKQSLSEAVEAYRNKSKELSDKYTVTKDQVLKQENMKKSVLDGQSEELASSFSAGKTNLSEFITEYMSKRIAYHELNAKINAAEMG